MGFLCFSSFQELGFRSGDAHGSAHSGVTHAFKHVAETRSRLANVVGKGRLGLRDFHPEV